MAIPKVYTVKEVAKLLHTSLNTIYDEIKANRLEHINVGKKFLINEDAINMWWDLKVNMVNDSLNKVQEVSQKGKKVSNEPPDIDISDLYRKKPKSGK